MGTKGNNGSILTWVNSSISEPKLTNHVTRSRDTSLEIGSTATLFDSLGFHTNGISIQCSAVGHQFRIQSSTANQSAKLLWLKTRKNF
ncbi:hypothetical protein L484_027492 [Morus notabilis]|uniref:Uncharacterized protein n=1 Tax=Morus notabilis TaxID=981085 RepID=W9SMH2_9ROSA|nr:hypothetical protein L484_027492 [Morus notabilis]